MATDFTLPAASRWHALRARLLGLAARVVVSASAAAQSTQAAAVGQQLLIDRQQEIALVLSACPRSAPGKAMICGSSGRITRSASNLAVGLDIET